MAMARPLRKKNDAMNAQPLNTSDKRRALALEIKHISVSRANSSGMEFHGKTVLISGA